MIRYSELSEQEKQKRRDANARWRARNPDKRVEYMRNYDKNRGTQKRLFRSAKQRSKNEGVVFNLEVQDIEVHSNCPVCNVEMKVSSKKGGTTSSPTLDKIIPEKGYVKGNIAVICKLCNSTKGSGSAELHRKIADYIEKNSKN